MSEKVAFWGQRFSSKPKLFNSILHGLFLYTWFYTGD